MSAGMAREQRDNDIDAPRGCPACGSRTIVTTSKVVTTDSYWRCADCGEVWNAARQRKANRYQPQVQFRR